MIPDKTLLYILSDAPPDDPLDCVKAARPHLAPHYAAIHLVGPGHALSVRALRRAYRPGVDRLLYDFTAPHDHRWAYDMLNDAAAAIMLGCHNLAQGVALADLRSAQRYAADGFRFSADATVGVLDATPASSATVSLPRPAVSLAAEGGSNDLVMAVAPGAVETAYAALLGLKGDNASLVVLTASRRDANDLTDIIAAFGMSAAHVRYARNRPALFSATTQASGLIDVTDKAAPALGDAAFVAGCIGAPVLRLSSTGRAGEAAAAFAASKPCRDPAAADEFAATRPLADFANDVHALIEAGFAHAMKRDAAA